MEHSISQQLSVAKLEKEMQARPDLRKSLEEFRKGPYHLRKKREDEEKQRKFAEILEEEKRRV